MNQSNGTVSESGVRSVFSGIIYSFISMGILALIISLLLIVTNIQEVSLKINVYIIHGIAIMIGGFITGRRTRMKGWYYGGMMGIIYCILIFLIGFLSFDSVISLSSLLLIIVSFTMGAFGGIIGVNTRR